MPTACHGHKSYFTHRSGQLRFSRRGAPRSQSQASRCRRCSAHMSGSTAAAPLDLKEVPIVMPEEYWLPPGELSTIDRSSEMQTHDIFRCFGCSRPECEVSNFSCQHQVACHSVICCQTSIDILCVTNQRILLSKTLIISLLTNPRILSSYFIVFQPFSDFQCTNSPSRSGNRSMYKLSVPFSCLPCLIRLHT